MKTPIHRFPARAAQSVWKRRLVGIAVLAGTVAALFAQEQLRVQPSHDSGQGVTPAFEGWFRNPDGSFSLLIGYFNRNLKEELDIPIGPDNRIEPGGPDMGQPTHFMPRRGWGVFTIKVPNDFGDKKLTWTLTVHGTTASVPFHLNPLWEVSPFKDASGNAPPYMGFDAGAAMINGPAGSHAKRKATVGSPLELQVWVADDAHLIPGAPTPNTPPVTLTWSKFRGPGNVTLTPEKPAIAVLDFAAPASTTFRGKATTVATFSEPGDYVLNVTANDWTGDGGRGFQCCWTNAQVIVQVAPPDR